VLEEFGYRRPALKQPPDPGHADQPDANLDAAGPVHAGQERVLLPPGLDLLRYPLRVRVIVAEVPRGREERQMLQPREFPDLLDVPCLLFRAMVDPECVPVARRATAGDWIKKPVRRDQVGPADAEHVPLALDQLVSASQHGRARGRGDGCGGMVRQDGAEPSLAGRLRLAGGRLRALYLLGRPRQP